MRFRIFPRKRSRFNQYLRKLQILRKKRGRKATGDSLLQTVIESLKQRNSKAAMSGLDEYLLLVHDLTSEERAIAGGLCRELNKLADRDAMLGRIVKVALWFVDVVDIIRRAVSPLIYHATDGQYCLVGVGK